MNGDQMLLHQNRSASQKTLNIKGYEIYFKKNYSLSSERITTFTQVSGDPNIVVRLGFIFTGKDTRPKLSSPE